MSNPTAGGSPTSEVEFERLITEQARVMSRAIRRVCGRHHQELIPDVEQEVRLALWKKLQTGKKVDYPVSYVYKVALTTALAVTRRYAPGEIAMDSEWIEAQPSAAPAAHDLSAPERTRLLEQVLAGLPQDQSRALRAYLAGFNHREVSGLYGWTESVARHRIYRGLEALRESARGTMTDER